MAAPGLHLAAAVVALAAMWTDWRRREVPDWIVGGLLCLWIVTFVFAPDALGFGAWSALLCGAVALAVGLACHAFGWLGGGDGKLLAVLALWLGPRDLPLALLGMALTGGVLVAAALVVRDGDFRRRGIPFACAMAPPAAALLLARALTV